MSKANKHQRVIDEALEYAAYEGIYQHGEEPVAGTEWTLDVRFGDEGPDSWSRVRATMEQRHIDKARAMAERG